MSVITGGIFKSPSTQDPSSTFAITASVFQNLLTVTATAGVLTAGQGVDDASGILPVGVTIQSQKSGSTGSTGVYYINLTLIDAVASEAMIVTLSPVGQAGPGSFWYQTDTFLLYARNTANTGWTLIGSVNTANFGLMPRSGGTLSSTLTGASGLTTKDGQTPFIAPPYVLSKLSQAATLADVNALLAGLETQISTQVATAISQVGVPGLRSNMAFGYGSAPIGTKDTSPAGSQAIAQAPVALPYAGMTYGDGTAVKLTDCYGFCSPYDIYTPNTGPILYLYPNDSTGHGMFWTGYTMSGSYYYRFLMNAFVIAIKPTS